MNKKEKSKQLVNKKVDETMKEKANNLNLQKIKLPTTQELENELKKVKYKSRYNKLLKNTFFVLLIVISLSSLIATHLFPVLEIYGISMEPTLNKGDIVVTLKKSNYQNGDIIAFYYNNRILVKRIVAASSQWVNIDEFGNVYVDDELLIESYIEEKSLGVPDIEFPYQIQDSTYFVLGDSREDSIDSRSSQIGTIKKEEIIGKVIFKVWPLKRLGFVK